MRTAALQRKLDRRFGGRVSVAEESGVRTLSGALDTWADTVAACQLAADKRSRFHVVNDILCREAQSAPPMRMPAFTDHALDGQAPDVLIIGGGISGATIARALSRFRLDVLLVDKESDLAMQASGRNDGEVHPGVDLGRGTRKQKYVVRGNRMFDALCRELSVPFTRCGQVVGFTEPLLYVPALFFALWRILACGVTDTRVLTRRQLQKREPKLNPDFAFALYNASAGCVCPYNLTIACAENAAANGARVMLNTAVTGMERDARSGRITAVHTNRGTLYPAIVVNAAGVFCEEIARMAGDRFYSVHPRRGTNSILDSKQGALVRSVASVKLFGARRLHTKGGGILHTVHGNLLVGPDAVETFEKENFETRPESIEAVFTKQKLTAPALSERDIITYFTGVRPATFEEDFVIERGRKTPNLVHCAGIQSPGLTTAPAVAETVSEIVCSILKETRPVERNEAFDPVRKGIPVLREMGDAERAARIAENPDYGVIVCRCEQISRGEILDALRSPLCPKTSDAVKRRVRPGMGRCQGCFCLPLVMKIIAEYTGTPVSGVQKSADGGFIAFRRTKGGNA